MLTRLLFSATWLLCQVCVFKSFWEGDTKFGAIFCGLACVVHGVGVLVIDREGVAG